MSTKSTIMGSSGNSAGSENGASEEMSTSSAYPTSYTQKRIWYSQQLDPDSSHWNVGMRWRLDGRLRDSTIEQAWQILADRHEVLRTSIEEFEGVAYQRVWSRYTIRLAVVDISRLPPSQRITAANEIARNDAMRPIPLAATPPYRIQLIRLDEETAILLTNFHNIIVDGWSVGILIREFGQIASSLEARVNPELPAPSMQHVDYSLWQEDMLESGSFERDKQYWKMRLADWKRFEIETDRPRPAVMTHEGDIRSLLLPPVLNERMSVLAKRHGVSMFHIGAATLAAMLSNANGNRDVFLGTQAACRDEPELNTLVGPLINTVALRFDASGDPTLLQLLKHCRERCSEAMSHQHLPFNFVVEALKPSRDPSRNLVYSITFTAQTAHIDTGQTGDLHFDGVTIAAIPSFSAGAPTDLAFFMVGREEGWRLSCAGNSGLFEISTVDRLLEKWAQAIEALAEAGDEVRLSGLLNRPAGTYVATGIGVEARAQSEDEASVPLPPQNARGHVEAVWQDVLGLSSIAPGADFFDLGGTSLSALRMLSKLSMNLGQSLPLVALLRSPTIDGFSGEVERLCSPSGATVAVRSVPSSETAPRNAIQPILTLSIGPSFRFIERRLGERYPMTSIPVGTEDDLRFARNHSFREVVARVVDRIIVAQPEGPYAILAYCALGGVAFEAARQLTEKGRKVKLIVSLNGAAPFYHESFGVGARLRRRLTQVGEALHNARVLCSMRRRGEISTGTLLQHYTVLRKMGLISLLRRFRIVEPTSAAAVEMENLLEFPVIIRDLLRAAPLPSGRIPADVAVYRSRDMLKGPFVPPALGWCRWVSGQCHVRDIEAPHAQMLYEPAAGEIATDLAALLDRIGLQSDGN